MAFSANWVLLGLFLLPLAWFFRHLLLYFWWTPLQFRLAMQQQGIRGPSSLPVLGNLLDIISMRRSVPPKLDAFQHHLLEYLIPEHVLWSKLYGDRFLIWWGPEASLVLSDPNLIKAIFSSRQPLSYGKPYLAVQKFLEPLVGQGLVVVNGEDWVHQRQIIGPAFRFEKLKGLAPMMTETAKKMLLEWDQLVKAGKGKVQVEVGEHLTKMTSDIIALTQFGSSYEKGKEIFRDLEYLRTFVFRYGPYLILPGSSFVPLPSFREMRRVKRRMEDSIRQIIHERKEHQNKSYGTDLLGMLLEENAKLAEDGKRSQLSIQQIVDECKTFFFAGQDTTAKLLTWSLLLLAEYPSWQERARAEVLEVCGCSPPNTDCLSTLKTLDMIIHETLRLYPPVVMIASAALKDLILGDLHIPKGMSFTIPILAIHLDKELWGEDVSEFNPGRFANGIGKACKSPFGFMPFSYGPRNCVGQNFALMEAKLILGMILQQFKLIASPEYCHAPRFEVTLRPGFGAPLILQRLDSLLP